MTFRRHSSLAPLGRDFLKRTLFFLTLTVLRNSGWVFCRLTLISAYLGFSRGKNWRQGFGEGKAQRRGPFLLQWAQRGAHSHGACLTSLVVRVRAPQGNGLSFPPRVHDVLLEDSPPPPPTPHSPHLQCGGRLPSLRQRSCEHSCEFFCMGDWSPHPCTY